MQDVRTKLIAASAATAVSVILLFVWISKREQVADGIIDKAIEHGAINSMIARETSQRPAEQRFEVAFQCADAPLQGVVVYAADAERARRDARRGPTLDGCKIVRSEPTTKPLCDAQRRCSTPYRLG